MVSGANSDEHQAWYKADDVYKALEAIPTIEPKRGEWVDDDFVGQYRCSECDYYAIDEYDFCPNCGADMHKESE
jgi:rubrerythrin